MWNGENKGIGILNVVKDISVPFKKIYIIAILNVNQRHCYEVTFAQTFGCSGPAMWSNKIKQMIMGTNF